MAYGDRMMTSLMTSRDLQGSKVVIPILLRPVISKTARERDSVLTGHHLPPQPSTKAVKNSLGGHMHSLSAF